MARLPWGWRFKWDPEGSELKTRLKNRFVKRFVTGAPHMGIAASFSEVPR